MGSAGAPPPCAEDKADSLGNTPLPHLYNPAEFGRSRSNDASLMKEIPLKNLTPRLPPFRVTQSHQNRIDRLPMTSY